MSLNYIKSLPSAEIKKARLLRIQFTKLYKIPTCFRMNSYDRIMKNASQKCSFHRIVLPSKNHHKPNVNHRKPHEKYLLVFNLLEFILFEVQILYNGELRTRNAVLIQS